mmetsp:Transcript_25776/g.60435  ORF Transcript_25776/g.60435 Transcript_25776/m.60435 type:complete len:468 (+) Transcript_25776:47-1450(+)
MTIRLNAVRTLSQNLKEKCRLAVPLICLARFLSERPIDWFFFWIGWGFLWSSSTYLLGKNGKFESSNVRSNIKRIEKSHNYRYCSRTRLCTATNSLSTNVVPHILLTGLPSALLCNIACCLHPRELLDLDTVLQTSKHTRRQYEDSFGHDVWKCLWYRDYGDVLLQWKISREAFRQSLRKPLHVSTNSLEFDNDINNQSNNDPDGWLEEQLSKRLHELTKISSLITMKDFYFTFGECYIDYVLARKNTIDECYLGLHGHIFDFTHFAEYHPGLIEPILKECGGDATFYFEDVPHSSGARNIALRLCVLVDHSAITCEDGYVCDSSNSRRCGLELVQDKDLSNLKKVLRSSNTRPPPLTAAERRKMQWISHLLPRRREKRRHPTLERIRTRFQNDHLRYRRQQILIRINQGVETNGSHSEPISSLVTMTTELISSCSPFWKQHDSMSRLYYDPLAHEWVRWCLDHPKI